MAVEKIDNIGFSNMQLIQAPDEFCFGVDAVILGDFAASFEKKNKESKAFDLGCGTGIIPLILSHKLPKSNVTAVEIQEDSYNRANRNFKLNNLDHRLKCINCNILDIDSSYYDTADFITSNPPYMDGATGLQNSNRAKTIARHEIFANLDDFFNIASKLLKDRGRFYLVHRPSRLVDILCFARKYRLEAKNIRFVCPKEGEIPNIVLVQFIKNGGKELKYLENLNVHNKDGGYTTEILEIYEKE